MRRRWVWALLLVAVAAGAWLLVPRPARFDYATVEASRGEVVRTIAAAGKLRALNSVKIGAELSGQIKRVTVDFNDPVRAGQVLAEIDPTSTRSAVEQAQAQIASARAAMAQGEAALFRAGAERRLRLSEYERQRALDRSGFATKGNVDSARARSDQATGEIAGARAQIAGAQAELVRGQASLERARLDLSRATIVSPIDGVVISRQIEAGQTLASSFTTPVLFEIAAGLERMQVQASVDEADIGQVRRGQVARFDVDAYPDERFQGVVSQVRKEATENNGAVTYTVMIEVDNRAGKLLPGMTANVEIVTGRVAQALRVPSTALAFTPPPADRARGGADEDDAPAPGERARARTSRTLWRENPDDADRPLAVEVDLGVRGDAFSQIVRGPVKVGDRFIARATRRQG